MTLTDAEWSAVCSAFALFEVDCEDRDDEREAKAADRAFDKIRDAAGR